MRVCVCVCNPFSPSVEISGKIPFSHISKYNFTLKLTEILGPEHYFSQGFELLKMGLEWQTVCHCEWASILTPEIT